MPKFEIDIMCNFNSSYRILIVILLHGRRSYTFRRHDIDCNKFFKAGNALALSITWSKIDSKTPKILSS